MNEEKDSDRLQRVVDAIGDDYKPLVRRAFEPEIFWAEPQKPSLKGYKQEMAMLLYLSQNPNLIKDILNKNA